MAILDIFSKRPRRLPDVYQHETLPERLRMQIVYVVDEMFTPRAGAWLGLGADDIKRGVYDQLHYHLAKEYGVSRLAAGIGMPNGADSVQRVQHVIRRARVGQVLDVVEVALHLAFEYLAKRREFGLAHPQASVDELNQRFGQHGVGYQIVGTKAVKTGSRPSGTRDERAWCRREAEACAGTPVRVRTPSDCVCDALPDFGALTTTPASHPPPMQPAAQHLRPGAAHHRPRGIACR